MVKKQAIQDHVRIANKLIGGLKMNYICHVCKNSEHRKGSNFCGICGTKIDIGSTKQMKVYDKVVRKSDLDYENIGVVQELNHMGIENLVLVRFEGGDSAISSSSLIVI